ncbi:MAG: hypothetical protein Q4E64_05525 [Phascolarctobacterium sp.]|uniref:hypothetical protein n=1 Tax=Phascolarctobacterium sp. TaxID=2049039 RepID=UPI0026DC9433|nr:hypothetical protein [Phascolarctobacterium sp.]MDO4921267.1 hypothetical protein [Phascolarctobacterium sp.]
MNKNLTVLRYKNKILELIKKQKIKCKTRLRQFLIKIAEFFTCNKLLIITLTIALVMLVICSLVFPNFDIQSLAINILASFIMACYSILIADRIVKQKATAELKPKRICLYREVQIFATRFLHLFEEMYGLSVGKKEDISSDKFFSVEVMTEIYALLNLETEANVCPRQCWRYYIINSAIQFRNDIDRILNVYGPFMESELFRALYRLSIESPLYSWANIMQQVYIYDLSEGFPRCPLLISYSPKFSTKDLEDIKYILSWCNREYQCLKEEGVYKVPEIIMLSQYAEEPRCRISSEDFQRFSTEINEYRNTKK